MNECRMNLDPRLSAIAELVGRCESYADIGCDHGRLGAFLLKSGQVRRAALTDISEDSLKKARRLIDRLGLNDRVDFKVGDGAQALDRAYPVVVIAGMGGALIEKLVREGCERLGGARLILQPNVAHYALRKGLMEAGYAITDERVAPDGRRNYLIIVAEPGEGRYTERELIAGPVLLKTLPETMKPFAAFYLRVAQKALAGAEKGGDAAQISALEREIAIWEDVLKCL